MHNPSALIIYCRSEHQSVTTIYITIMDSNPPKPGLIQSSAIFLATSTINYFLRFLIGVLIARAFGAEGKGVYSLVLLTGSMLLVVLNIGTGSALTYFTAGQKLESRTLVGYAIITGTLLGVLGGIIFLVAYQLFLSQNMLAGLQDEYVMWVAFVLPFNLIGLFLGAILVGLQRILVFNALDLVRTVFLLGLLLISMFLGYGVSGAILAWIISCLAYFVVICAFTLHQVGVQWKIHLPSTRPLVAYGTKSYLANIMTIFTYRLDSYLVNYFLGVSSVGIYSTSVATAEMVWNIPNAVSAALFPKISGLDQESGSLLTARACRILILLTIPLTILLSLLGYFLIPPVFGPQFQASVLPFLLLLPGMIFVLISKILSANLSGRGTPQYSAYIAAIALSVTILLDMYLIPRYGVPGASMASSVAYFAGAIGALYWFRKTSGISWKLALIANSDDMIMVKDRAGQAVRAGLQQLKRSS